MSTSKDKKIEFSEYKKHFSDQVCNADNLRNESLQRLRKIRVSRQKNQQRQLNRLTEKFGENDTNVKRQAERIVMDKEVIKYMDLAIDKTTTDTDTIKDAYILRGKIRDSKINKLSGHTVQLVDKKNNIIGEPVKTDSNGNYAFVVDVKEGEEPEKLKIAVIDKQGTQVYLGKFPISLRADVVDTRDIVISNIENDITRKVKGRGGIKTIDEDKVNVTKSKTRKKRVPKVKTVKKKSTNTIKKRKSGDKKPK